MEIQAHSRMVAGNPWLVFCSRDTNIAQKTKVCHENACFLVKVEYIIRLCPAFSESELIGEIAMHSGSGQLSLCIVKRKKNRQRTERHYYPRKIRGDRCMTNSNRLGRVGLKLLATSIILAPLAAYAQPDASEAYPGGGSVGIEEITVTARRVEESLQSVPISVTALDDKALREATITSFADLQTAVPGVYLGGSGGQQNPVYVIRGQSKGLHGTSSPAVVSYFAEVPQPSWGSAVPQFDMQSIQVLKGAQGTLFGRNTTGGAILYTPQRPEHEFGGYAGISFGDEDHSRVQAAVNIPIAEDKVALRLAGDLNQRDGYTRNIGVGADLDALDTTTFRMSLLAEFGQFSNLLIVDHLKSENDGFNISLKDIFVPSALNLLAVVDQVQTLFDAQRAAGPRVNYSSFPQHENNERTAIVNRTEFTFGNDMQLINIFGHQATDLDYAPNIDGLPLVSSPVVGAGFTASTGLTPTAVDTSLVKAVLIDQTKQISNEIQLRGNAFDSRLDWILGAFWLKAEPDGAGQINATTVFQSEISFVHPLAGPTTALTSPLGAQHLFITDESQAVFGHFKYALTDEFGLELGIRYTEDDFEACIGSGAVAAYNGQRPPTVSESACRAADTSQIVNPGVVRTSSEEVTWNVGVNWQATDDVFVFGVARHGYRAGGANGPVFDDLMAPYQIYTPEEIDSIEIGIRADWHLGDTVLRTNASYFTDDISNAQGDIAGGATTPAGAACTAANPGPDGDCDPTDDPTGGALVLNLGDTSVDGIDIELVLAATQYLTLSFSGTFQDADVDSLLSQPNPFIQARVGGAQPFLNFADETFQANVRYAVPLSSIAEELVFNVDYYDTSDVTRGDIVLPAYNLTNLRADLNGLGNGNFDVSFYVSNVTDEEYTTGTGAASTALGIGSFIWGPPRLWGLEARYSF